MNNLVTKADFTGFFNLTINSYDESTFDEIIEDVQERLIVDLIGCKLYNEFAANISGNNPLQKWVDFRDGKTYTDFQGYEKNYKGLKYLLIPIVYFHYIDFNRFAQVTTGTVEPANEITTRANEYNIKTLMFKSYNEFINRYYETFNFLYSNENDYTDFLTFFKEKSRKGIITKSNVL